MVDLVFKVHPNHVVALDLKAFLFYIEVWVYHVVELECFEVYLYHMVELECIIKAGYYAKKKF